MNQQIFTIRGTHDSFFNLKDAIDRAEELTYSRVIARIKRAARLNQQYNSELAKYYDEKVLRNYPVHFTTTVANLANSSIRVRAKSEIPIGEKHVKTYSNSCVIDVSHLPSYPYYHGRKIEV